MIPIRFVSVTCGSPNSKLWWWLRRAVYHCVLKQVRLSMIWAHSEALRPCLRVIAHVQLMLSMMKANMRPFCLNLGRIKPQNPLIHMQILVLDMHRSGTSMLAPVAQPIVWPSVAIGRTHGRYGWTIDCRHLR